MAKSLSYMRRVTKFMIANDAPNILPYTTGMLSYTCTMVGLTSVAKSLS